MAGSSINRMGWVCAGLIVAMLSLSLSLHCFARAVPVVLVCGLAGAALGAALAMVTRTRSPLGIYAWFAAAALTFLPLARGWPPGDSFDIAPWRGAPDICYNYFDFLRGCVYLLAMPFPFARLGKQGPDSST